MGEINSFDCRERGRHEAVIPIPEQGGVDYVEMEEDEMPSLDSWTIEMLELDEARERWVKFFFKFYIFSCSLTIFL